MWVVLKAISRLRSDLTVAAPQLYFDTFRSIASSISRNPVDGAYEYLATRDVSIHEFEAIQKIGLPEGLFDELLAKHLGPGIAWRKSIDVATPKVVAFLEEAAIQAEPLEAILLWTNSASVREWAKNAGVPTIHNEVGPLRPPHYRATAYFDFSGVNGRTEADIRWVKFLAEDSSVPVLDRTALLKLFSSGEAFSDPSLEHKHPVGVALQVPGDSNLIAFGNGFSNYEAIQTALHWFPGQPLVRPHPAQAETVEHLDVTWDRGTSVSDFFNSVDAVLTVNSSVGFEALLHGKPSYILGESPFSLASWHLPELKPKLKPDMLLRWLNWFLFAYLIPFEKLFDVDYYRWRLTNPSEAEIYVRNLRTWMEVS
ncbi:hypothetical protein A6R70_23265 [Agrobacterium rubi]|nr:hypothetical protein [Agrobacterium rubi]